MNIKSHWERVYTNSSKQNHSWQQIRATLSLEIIQSCAIDKNSAIIDIGSGTSTLSHDLIELGYTNLSLLDISKTALDITLKHIGQPSNTVNFLNSDILTCQLPENKFSLWHDRAVFHFLTSNEQQQQYIETMKRSLREYAHIIIATFADDGPIKCSGLDVQRYSADQLSIRLGDLFRLVSYAKEVHQTPSMRKQNFIYCHFIYQPAPT